MSPSTHRRIAVLAATAVAAVPAAALADTALRGAVSLRTVGPTSADVTFAVSAKLPRRSGGGVDAHRTAAYPLARFTDRAFANPGLLRAAERLEAERGQGGGQPDGPPGGGR